MLLMFIFAVVMIAYRIVCDDDMMDELFHKNEITIE